MSVAPGTAPSETPGTPCCICAQVSAGGARDKAGRFVCADCLERARQAILQRNARAARAKFDAKLEAEVARAESDNSAVLEWRSALDPALALLCPNCGRILHIDVGACHSCGYGVEGRAPARRFSLFARRRGSRPPVAPHLLDFDIPWLNAMDSRVSAVLPWALAVLLWTMTALAWTRTSARVTATIMVVTSLSGFAAWYLGALWPRSPKAAALSAAPFLATLLVCVLDPYPPLPMLRWTALSLLLVIGSITILTRARGLLVPLWIVAVIPAVALVVLHAGR